MGGRLEGLVDNNGSNATAGSQANGAGTDPRDGSSKEPVFNELFLARMMHSMIRNATLSRRELARGSGDERRNINLECGHPTDDEVIDIQAFQEFFDRHPVARRVVEVYAKECWQVQPTVFSNQKGNTKTAFEEGWDDAGHQVMGTRSWFRKEQGSVIWDFLKRADIQSRIGHYGVILVGIDDVDPTTGRGKGLEEPAEESISTKATRKLTYLRVFPETLAQITKYDDDPASPRYGQPTEYNITFHDPKHQLGGMVTSPQVATRPVHWTRVVHIALDVAENEISATPSMEPVWGPLLDIRKVLPSSAEMYWVAAFPGMSLETLPSLGGNVRINQAEIKTMMEDWSNGLQRWIQLRGLTAKMLAPAVSDPTPQVKLQITAICIQLGIPERIFMGSERGELASSQDDGAWNDRLKERQQNTLSPRLIAPFVDRLIILGVLPDPGEDGYIIHWPDVTSHNDSEKASIAQTLVAAMVAWIQGGGEALMTPMRFLTTIMRLDDDEAEAIVEEVRAVLEQEDQTETGASPLASMVGGITGMIELFKLAKEGGLSEEQLKQQIMFFFKVSDDLADQLIAEGLTTVAEEAGEPPAEEPGPPSPVKVREGEALVDPESGDEIAKIPSKQPIGKPKPAFGAKPSANQYPLVIHRQVGSEDVLQQVQALLSRQPIVNVVVDNSELAQVLHSQLEAVFNRIDDLRPAPNVINLSLAEMAEAVNHQTQAIRDLLEVVANQPAPIAPDVTVTPARVVFSPRKPIRLKLSTNPDGSKEIVSLE